MNADAGNALAPYASDPRSSRGRRHDEPAAPAAEAFQLDRERVVHSSAFRRLAYKTQVFLNHEGDLFRTRLTHSIEVAQIGRAIARRLNLNEDLVEAIALAHDLGHTPFGHAGQEALHGCMMAADPDSCGFEHNLQGLRVVDRLEERHPGFGGLNLCFETREGILKHCSRASARRLAAGDPSGIGRRFLEGTQPSLEAQLCNLADQIAYNAHDIDDGVRSGLLVMEQLLELPLLRRLHGEVQHELPALAGRPLLFEMLRRLLAEQVEDLCAATRAAIDRHRPESPDDVRQSPALVRSSTAMRDANLDLQQFLRRALYRHPRVQATTDTARRVVCELFEAYRSHPGSLPTHPRGSPLPLRALADYIAGMTDRFALGEHRRLTGQRLEWPDLPT